MIEDNIQVSILIVDDNPAKLVALEAALDGMDIEIVTAASGMEALRRLLDQEFAAVLLDVNMPIMDGFETAEMIRRRPRSEHLPIIFITAERLTDDARLKGYDLGAVDYILSPVLPQILRAKASVFADLYRLRERSYRYGDELLGKNEEICRLNDELEQKVIARTAALEHARLELEQANRGKDEFLAAISHELKTPLNHILGFADLLKEGLAGELSAEQKEMAQDIFDAGNRELAIVNSLIELARLQGGKVKLQAEPQDPAKLLAEIATRYAAKAEASGLAFAVELAKDLGEMPLDREVVTNVLDQLLANAFKFTPSGGRISLTARRVPHTDVAAPARIEAGEYLELAVADNGPGIAPDILPRLFQSFVQGEGGLNRSHGGTGVGLVLVRLLAELHGGGSGVQSEPGAGAKFLVWLPYAAAEMEAASPQPSATLPQA